MIPHSKHKIDLIFENLAKLGYSEKAVKAIFDWYHPPKT
jgi:hypothetical protein